MGRDASTSPALQELDEAWDDFLLAFRRARARTGGRREGLTLTQYELLAPLLDEDGLAVGRLAELAGVSAPTATGVIDALSRSGLVRRARSRRDRRSVILHLTAEGRRLVLERRRAAARRRLAFLSGVASRDRRRTARMLRDLAALMSDL